MSDAPESSRPFFDPGWLFLAAGLAALGAAVIIPAYDEVAEARFRRERALAVEAHREARIARYEEFLGAVEERDPHLVESLAASQLNQIPTDRAALPASGAKADASVFPSLEPDPIVLPEREKQLSKLEWLVTDGSWRRWVIVGGAVCVLIGLLPVSKRAS